MLEEYQLIKHRRNGSTIYQCKHHTHYMKVGNEQTIASEVEMYTTIHKYWFPLPTLLEYTLLPDGISFMKEESLEGNLFADIFTQDCEQHGVIQKNNFDSFCLYQKNHLFFQKTTQDKNLSHNIFQWFEDLYEENIIEKSLIDECRNKVEHSVKEISIVWNHGDHNPYNIFTDGLIDLEDSFDGPLWYDTITAVTQNFRFPSQGWELNQQHIFTPDQILHYLTYCSNKDINLLDNDIFGTLFLMRWMFATVKSEMFPTLRNFRYKKLEQVMKKYTEWSTDFLDYFIEHYQTPVI